MKSTKESPTRFRFTQRNILALPAHPASASGKATEVSDTEVVGLKCQVSRDGRKVFYFRYSYRGVKRAARIGEFPGVSVTDARQLATEKRGLLDRGGDPQDEHDRLKAMPTFAEFVTEEYLPWVRQVKKSARDDESKIRLHLNPKFGSRRLGDICRRDVEMHQLAIRASHSVASSNRHLALLSAIFRQAVAWGRVVANPCAGVKAFRETNARQRYLSDAEIARLYVAMAAEPNQMAVAVFKLALMTGARRGELLGALWSDIDLERGLWHLPMTKNGRSRFVTLNASAKSVLAGLERGRSPYVFPGRDPAKPACNVTKAFKRLLTAAGISDMRIHDLRHTHASLLANNGVSMYVIAQSLGHQAVQTTQRYAHLGNETMRTASEVVAKAVREAVAA